MIYFALILCISSAIILVASGVLFINESKNRNVIKHKLDTAITAEELAVVTRNLEDDINKLEDRANKLEKKIKKLEVANNEWQCTYAKMMQNNK